MSPREWIHDVGNGPFIGIMIFIVAITAGSVLFAKYCVGDRAFMRTGYDFEGYVMRKCPVCVGLPKRTHPHVEQIGPLPLEVEVEVVAVEGASEPAAPAPPPFSAATPAPPPAAVAVPVAVAAEEEEDDEDEVNEDLEEDDDEEEFDFEAFERAEALGL